MLELKPTKKITKMLRELTNYKKELSELGDWHYFNKLVSVRSYISPLVVEPKNYKKIVDMNIGINKKTNKWRKYSYLYHDICISQFPTLSPAFMIYNKINFMDNVKILNLTNMLQFIEKPTLSLYLDNNSIKNYNCDLWYFPDAKSTTQLHMRYKPDLNIKTFRGGIELYTNYEPYDIIFTNMIWQEYPERYTNHNELMTAENILNVLSMIPKLLNPGGTLVITGIPVFYTIKMNNIILSLYKLFKEVTFHCSSRVIIICTGYNITANSFIINLSTIREAMIQHKIDSCKKIANMMKAAENNTDLIIDFAAAAKLEAMNIYKNAKIPLPPMFYNIEDIIAQPEPFFFIYIQEKQTEMIKSASLRNNLKAQDIKTRLFIQKRGIDGILDLDKYEKITDKFNVSSLFKKKLKKINGNEISQAFLKITEILHNIKVIKKCANISVLHLCEAPGQFILGFMHYCKNNGIDYKWKATSLKSGFGDRYGLMKKYPQSWTFGINGTGDITDIDNIKYLAQNKYDIVTSDCGLCTDTFGMQEEQLSRLNYYQITAILLCLLPGGNALFKTFLPGTLPQTISLFYILHSSFNEVIYFKPSLNPSSSEYYVICLGYKPINNYAQKLASVNKIDNYNAFLVREVDSGIINKHYLAMEGLTLQTTSYIRRSLTAYFIYNKYEKQIIQMQNKYVSEWIQKYL